MMITSWEDGGRIAGWDDLVSHSLLHQMKNGDRIVTDTVIV